MFMETTCKSVALTKRGLGSLSESEWHVHTLDIPEYSCSKLTNYISNVHFAEYCKTNSAMLTVLLNSFCVNCHTSGFCPQTEKLWRKLLLSSFLLDGHAHFAFTP